MFFKKLYTITALLLMAQSSYAQTDTTVQNTVPVINDHYFGVQLNELIRQVTFKDPTAVVTQNPYLFTYAERSQRTNWGIRAGLGIQAGQVENTISNGEDTSNKLFAVQLRFGVARWYQVSRKLVMSVGFDLVFNYSSADEKFTFNVGFANNEETKVKTTTGGGGPVASVMYQITNKMALGTEASGYYITGNTRTTHSFSGSSNDRTNNKNSNGTFNSPVAIYFIVKI